MNLKILKSFRYFTLLVLLGSNLYASEIALSYLPSGTKILFKKRVSVNKAQLFFQNRNLLSSGKSSDPTKPMCMINVPWQFNGPVIKSFYQGDQFIFDYAWPDEPNGYGYSNLLSWTDGKNGWNIQCWVPASKYIGFIPASVIEETAGNYLELLLPAGS